jgi:5-hydroxyisourate hydrolase
MTGISTHVLDAALGRPAAGVQIRLEGPDGVLATTITDSDGRSGELVAAPVSPGTYRLIFGTAAYFAATDQQGFYPEVSITFTVEEGHYHVPLLLSPFAYTTYRGS